MRVLMVTQFFLPVAGGEERAVADLALGLARAGHEVALATTTAAPPDVVPGVTVHRVRTTSGRVGGAYTDAERRHVPPFPDPEAAVGLRRVMRAVRPDMVHAHNWLVHSLLPVMPRGVPLVLSLHDHSLRCANKRLMRAGSPCEGPALTRCVACARAQYGALMGPLTALGLRPSAAAVLRRAAMLLPVSHALADALGLERAGVPYRVLPNVLPPDVDARGAVPPGLPERFLLFAGDLAPDKGIGVALDAHARVPGAPPLVLVGRRLPATPALDRPGVVTLGRLPHDVLMAVMRRADGVLVPSITPETFGLVALEAMAAARPVVVSRAGGLPELVEDGVHGFVVPPGDAGALAAALDRLLALPDRGAAMGRAGRARARAHRPEAVIPLLEEAYAAAGAGGAGRWRAGTTATAAGVR